MDEREKTAVATEREGTPVRKERKSYSPPTLRRLGSVRELTHARGCISRSDGVTGMMTM